MEFNDKPVSLSIKQFIIRNMSVKMNIQERTLETVINHQFESALNSLDTCNSLEFSGFGKIFFNRKKAIRKIEKLERCLETYNSSLLADISALRKKNLETRILSAKRDLEYLNQRIRIDDSNGEDKLEPGIRGMEEPSVPPRETEGSNSIS
jgi:nucleoid DNA-binding protein